MSELQRFFETWDTEAQQTLNLLRSLPEGKYDFRPWSDGRSLGELAWHLAEVDAYMSSGIVQNGFGAKPPGIERPRQIKELAPGYERVHRESVARIKSIADSDLDRTIPFFDGRPARAPSRRARAKFPESWRVRRIREPKPWRRPEPGRAA